MTNAYTRVLVCVGALTLGLAPFARAQAQQPSSQQPSSQQHASQSDVPKPTVTSAEVTDQEVEQFAKIYEDVNKIQKDTQKQLEGVQDDTGIAKVKQEANQKMAAAVSEHGMKVDRFNLIARSLDQDATLKQRIQQKVQELRQPAQ